MRLYDRLFSDPDPDSPKHDKDYREFLNPDSLEALTGCKLEPSLSSAKPGDRVQLADTNRLLSVMGLLE